MKKAYNHNKMLESTILFLEAIGEEAQRALRERPSVSIRARVAVGFILWLILSLGITIGSIITVSQIQKKL